MLSLFLTTPVLGEEVPRCRS
ncbi:MAG: hypothetical protein QOH75_3606, partial [Actinomycetota bacterium]|nr:hypothetical protein [Actinomycetota bacterium]